MHKQYLLAALEQAFKGRGLCAPNPSVGAIAVHNGEIIARSSHRGAGTPHAEQLLLNKLPKNITDLTLYVTLEPCNHWGKTPPCVDEIINYGVKRVVFAYRDPNPIIIANDSQHRLRSHHIEVIHFPLPEIDEFYASYHQWTLTQRPWVTVKMAQSLDGKIAASGGSPIHLSNAECATFTHQQRAQCDVLLTTVKTVNQDNPRFNARLATGTLAKPLAIIDTDLQLNPTATVFNTAKQMHIYYNEQHSAPETHLDCHYHAMPSIDGKLDLKAVILHLGQLGYHDVWVEAGGIFFNALLKTGWVNRTHLYLVPTVLGSAAISAFSDPSVFNQPARVTWQQMGDNIMLTLDWLNAMTEASCLPV